jgi:phosphate transport system substrate-binding protein
MKNASSVKLIVLAFISILATITFSCSDEPRETPTSGSLTMITAEDVAPVIDLQVQDFSRVYEKTKITNLRSSTRDAIVQLLNDSVKLIIIPREFNAEEKGVVEKNSLEVSSTKIAYDGVAVIVNTANRLDSISVRQLHDILAGKKRVWADFKDSKREDAVVVGVEGRNSGVYEYVKGRLVPNEEITAAVNVCTSIPEVLRFVNDNANAIGFVPISWLQQPPSKIKTLSVGDPNFKSDSTTTTLEYFSPHPAYIYRGYYPLSRPVYIYLHNPGKGVALGFTSFAAGVQGQRIIVRNGLVPATMPVRLVQLNNQ